MKIMIPQDAAIMKGSDYDKIIKNLKQSFTLGLLKPLEESKKIYAVIDGEEVPAFDIPISIFDNFGNEKICVDLRSARKEFILTPSGNEFKPNELTDTKFLVNHALMQSAWKKGIGTLSGIYWDAGRIYANWCGLKITKRLNLSANDQQKMIIYFAYYFYTRGYDTGSLGSLEYTQLVDKMSQLFMISPQEISHYLAYFDSKIYTDLDEFCKEVAIASDNPKLKSFNRIVLQSMLIGSWLGLNTRKLVALAAEYPPTLLIMIYRGLTERSFKDTDISQLALRLMNSVVQKNYTKIIDDILYNEKMS